MTLECIVEILLLSIKGIIDAIADLVPVVKPQVAFYSSMVSRYARV